jgi:glutamate decarboxylase
MSIAILLANKLSLRVVVRPHVNHNVAELVSNDINAACKFLEEHGGNATPPKLHAHAPRKTAMVKS